MILPSASSKVAPIIAPPIAVALASYGLDAHLVIKTVAIVFGLIGGAVWRAGMLKQHKRTWPEIRDDLVVSMMIGIANGILALFLSEKMGGGVLLAMLTGVAVGVTGVRAVESFKDEFLARARGRASIDKKGGDDDVV